MTMTERRVGDVTILGLVGRLVLEDGVDELRDRITALVEEGRIRLIADMGHLSFVDSCGIGILISKLVSLRRRGGDLRLLNVTARGQHLLEITRLEHVFQLYTKEEDAIASFPPATEP
jgi:anti-sigma B factor antagonist